MAAVGHNADDIAETVIMNGITFTDTFYYDNFDNFLTDLCTHRTYWCQFNDHFSGEPVLVCYFWIIAMIDAWLKLLCLSLQLLHIICLEELATIHPHTHTHTRPFNVPFSRTTRVSWHQKGTTNLDFTEARDSEWQWHQLGHMQVHLAPDR